MFSAPKAMRRSCSCVKPSKRRTPASTRMSSSSAIACPASPLRDAGGGPPRRGSGNELVPAAFCHKNFGFGRIALDLLPQAVDMGLQRVGRHAGIVAPDLLEKHIA